MANDDLNARSSSRQMRDHLLQASEVSNEDGSSDDEHLFTQSVQQATHGWEFTPQPSADIKRALDDLSQDCSSESSPMKTFSLRLALSHFDYFQNLEPLGPDSAETLFKDLDTKELQKFADILADTVDQDGSSAPDPGWIELLVRIFYEIFERTDDIHSLNAAAHASNTLLSSTDFQGQDYALRLKDLLVILIKIYQRSEELEDLDDAICRAEAMVSIIEPSDPDYWDLCMDFCKLKVHKHSHTQSADDQEAVELLIKQTLLAAGVPKPEHQAIKAYQKFTKTGNPSDLDRAILKSEEAIATDLGETERGAVAALLNIALHEKFLQTSDPDYLNQSIVRGEEAVALLPTEEIRTEVLRLMSTVLQTRFRETGDLDHLDQAIAKGEEALATMPENYPAHADTLKALSESLHSRFERAGNLADLNRLIGRIQQDIASTPDGHPDRTEKLARLLSPLSRRFENTGNLEDLTWAITYGEQAIAATAQDDPRRSERLLGLMGALLCRYNRQGDLDDLDKAIKRGEEGMAASNNDVERACFLSNLMASHVCRFKRTANLQDLDEGIAMGELCLAIIGRTNVWMSTNLSVSYLLRFSQTRRHDDLTRAIAQANGAVGVTHDGDVRRAAALWNLSRALMAKFEEFGDPIDRESATALLRRAVDSFNAPPQERINCALKCIEQLIERGDWATASHITEVAVGLLPSVSQRALEQSDQQYMLRQFAGLATSAASISLQVGKPPYHAVKLLEMGRGVMTSLQFGAHTDLRQLKEQHSEIAERFERLRDVLSPSRAGGHDSITAKDETAARQESNYRHDANVQFDSTVHEIRQLPGFENFLLPPSAEHLMSAASQGPVIMINVSQYRSDALLIEQDKIHLVPLPNLHQPDIYQAANIFRAIRHVPMSSQASQKCASGVLEWLWDTTTSPILEALGFREPPSDDEWPHVWWIPTGLLSLLPLHAAGRHYSGSTETVLDRVVSSYSPSIKALLHARQNVRKGTESAAEEALLVSMPSTEGQWDLEFARREVDAVNNILSSPISRTVLERPDTGTVMNKLSTCTVFHFAGHGVSDSLDPSRSRLLLCDGERAPLPARDLSRLNLNRNRPVLAYLSACSTGENQAPDLQDESIHLISAFQLAGFRHVIGSLWEVSDQFSVHAAEEVYRTITVGGSIDETKMAWGVHKAIRRLRDITSMREQYLSGQDGCDEANDDIEEECLAVCRKLFNIASDSRGGNLTMRLGRRVRPEGYEEVREEIGNPLVWAPYIHVGPS